jgi:hypothetical protein
VEIYHEECHDCANSADTNFELNNVDLKGTKSFFSSIRVTLLVFCHTILYKKSYCARYKFRKQVSPIPALILSLLLLSRRIVHTLFVLHPTTHNPGQSIIEKGQNLYRGWQPR